LRELSETTGETRQVVVFGINGPVDLIQRLKHLEGSLGDESDRLSQRHGLNLMVGALIDKNCGIIN